MQEISFCAYQTWFSQRVTAWESLAMVQMQMGIDEQLGEETGLLGEVVGP